ncbi:MAG TPA: hypothetical protein VL523_18270 [Terriglobia bacterium]|nr:hypothetical protein [Terriglobia bacterium]
MPVVSAGSSAARLRPQNKRLLKWIDRWLDSPDDRGDAWWNEFEADLHNHRVTFRPAKTVSRFASHELLRITY